MKWPMVKLEILVKKVSTWNPSASVEDIDFLYIDLSSVDKDQKKINARDVKNISAAVAPSRARQLVKENDVLIATVRPNLNGVALVTANFDGATASTGYCVLRTDKNKLDERYLFYWVQSIHFIRDMISKATGANYPAVSDKIIFDSKIPLPPLTEQKRIAAILDKADAIRQKRQQAISLADDFLRSVFLDMFGDPVTNPLGWKTGSLIDFGDFKNGLNYTSSEVGEEVFCIGVGDFKSLDRIEGVSSLSKINLSSLPKNDYFVDEGDILFVRSNGNKELVGRNVIVYPEGSKVTFSGFCIRYRINDKDSLSNLYLSHCLKIPSMRKLLLSGGQGANIQNISQKTLSELTIPIPSIDMQNTYNEIVNGHQRLIKKSNDDFLKSYELFNSISKKAFSGQL